MGLLEPIGLPDLAAPPIPPLCSVLLSLGRFVLLALTPDGASGGFPELPFREPLESPALMCDELRLPSLALLSLPPLLPPLLFTEGVPLSPLSLPRPPPLLLLPYADLGRSFGGGDCSAPIKLSNTSASLQSL